MPVAILVGIPVSLRARVERHVGRRIEIRVLPMKQDGGYRLESPPGHASRLLSDYADEADIYEDVIVLLLPYGHIPDEVLALAQTLAELNATVIRPIPNSGVQGDMSDWPARSPRLDKKFQDELCAAVCKLLDRHFPLQNEIEGDREVACDVIRGLAVHSKMGPNNHSHEVDLWKTGGHTLGPAEREWVIRSLLQRGILRRKKNKSIGGTGWVYWIADVQMAREFCPDLSAYFK